MPYGKPKMYGKPKSAGLKVLAAKNKNLEYVGPKMSGGGPQEIGAQERYSEGPFNYKAQAMMAKMPMMYGAGKPKSTDGDPDPKKKPTRNKEQYVSDYIQKKQKEKGSNLSVEELMAAKESAEGLWKQETLNK